MLEVVGLHKRFGGTVALDGVTFTVPAGAMFGLVGANGAGKTTMRLIMGPTAADAGEVRWRGAPPGFDTRRRFGYLPEERGLYAGMRVSEQIEYFARLHGLPAPGARRAADTWIERLGLGGQDVGERLVGNGAVWASSSPARLTTVTGSTVRLLTSMRSPGPCGTMLAGKCPLSLSIGDTSGHESGHPGCPGLRPSERDRRPDASSTTLTGLEYAHRSRGVVFVESVATSGHFGRIPAAATAPLRAGRRRPATPPAPPRPRPGWAA